MKSIEDVCFCFVNVTPLTDGGFSQVDHNVSEVSISSQTNRNDRLPNLPKAEKLIVGRQQ